jgi:hypothetical protein
MFDVDELKPDVVSHPRCTDEFGNQTIEIVVRKHAQACRKPPVQSRMLICDERLSMMIVVRSGEPARVRQLQADVQIVRGTGAEPRAVFIDEGSAQVRECFLGAFHEQELIGICTAVVTYGYSLASPDQLCATESEVSPSADCQIAGTPVDRAVPAFHRQDAEAVSHADVINMERLSERRLVGPVEHVIEVQGDLEAREMPAKRIGRLE